MGVPTRDAHLHEEAGEELRDLYVALTRAQSQVVTWWAPTAQHPDGGLHRLLFGRQPGQPDVPDTAGRHATTTTPSGCSRLLGELGGPRPERSRVVGRRTPSAATASAGADGARGFGREVDTEWRRTSYSGLIRVQEQPTGVTSEPEVEDCTDDEPSGETEASLPEAADIGPTGRSPPSHRRWPTCRPGRRSAAWCTACWRRADPEAPDLRAELAAHTREQLQWWPVGVAADELADALLPVAAHAARGRSRRACGWSTSRCATACASSTSSSR